MKRRIGAVIAAAAVMLGISPAWAQHSHGGAVAAGGDVQMDSREVLVDDVRVSFAVMANAEHLKMLTDMQMKEDVPPGTTHNVTVVLKNQGTGREITDATVGMRVIDPAGKDEVKTLKYEEMMKSYDGYFNMPEKGKYQILIIFRTGGQKKTAGIYYDRR